MSEKMGLHRPHSLLERNFIPFPIFFEFELVRVPIRVGCCLTVIGERHLDLPVSDDLDRYIHLMFIIGGKNSRREFLKLRFFLRACTDAEYKTQEKDRGYDLSCDS